VRARNPAPPQPDDAVRGKQNDGEEANTDQRLKAPTVETDCDQ
jgi:hypothetical protein